MNPAAVRGRDLYFRLLNYVVPYWRIFAISVLCMATLAATEPALPWLLKILLDDGFIEGYDKTRLLVPALFVVLFLLKGVLSYAGNVALHWVSHRVVMNLRNEMFSRLLELPVSYYDASASAQLISKITFDVTQVSQAATQVVTVVVKDTLTILALLLLMLYVRWQLALVVLALGLFMAYAVYAISHKLREMSKRVQRSMGTITHVAQEGIEGQKAVKIFAGRGYEADRFATAANDARKYAMRVVMAAASNVPIIQFILAIGLALSTYLALALSTTQALSAGEFLAFMTAAIMLLPPSKRLTGVNEHLQRGLAAAESVFGLIDEQAEADSGIVELPEVAGELRFESVSFAYADDRAEALTDVSLLIQAGQTIALVGSSGSGKTTLANLVPRFYRPTGGRILVDGIDIEELSLSALRARIGLVSQEVVLFNDTVRNNIAYGAMRGVDESAVIAAAQAAHVLEFVEQLPQGLDTLIGEAGVRLSGGQRQRLAIARALLKDAPILILDEATSSLDAISERHIQDALEVLRRGRTCLIIAHRLSTVENADCIVVLDNGQIAESGTHRELLSRNGAYTRLYRHDLAAQDSPAVSASATVESV